MPGKRLFIHPCLVLHPLSAVTIGLLPATRPDNNPLICRRHEFVSDLCLFNPTIKKRLVIMGWKQMTIVWTSGLPTGCILDIVINLWKWHIRGWKNPRIIKAMFCANWGAIRGGRKRSIFRVWTIASPRAAFSLPSPPLPLPLPWRRKCPSPQTDFHKPPNLWIIGSFWLLDYRTFLTNWPLDFWTLGPLNHCTFGPLYLWIHCK